MSLPIPAEHRVVQVSGGKDSSAVYALLLERFGPDGFTAWTCDTGHESQITYDYIADLPERTGGPAIRVLRADFSARMATRRANLPELWSKAGIPQARIDRALELLWPTGNPFLDLCILKGRFPSTKARFCTEQLKLIPAMNATLELRPSQNLVLRYLGVRRDESAARRNVAYMQRGDVGELIVRPIADWSADDVFAFLRRTGTPANPLYRMGFGRVGCMPCIMCAKQEMREISIRFPDEVERVREWECLVADASRPGSATFFAGDKAPHAQKDRPEGSGQTIDEIAKWAMTSRGGRQYDMEALMPTPECTSIYGLCE